MPIRSFKTMNLWLSSLAGKLPTLTTTEHWHECPRCESTTPWHVNALRGEYRCLHCGSNPLEA